VAVHSPAGEAQEEMSLPFDERQLRDKLKDLEIALLRSGGTQRALSTEEQTVQEFGRSLFEAVLVGKVGTCYYRSMDQAQQEERRDGRSRRKLRHRSGVGWWLIVRNGADRIEMLPLAAKGTLAARKRH